MSKKESIIPINTVGGRIQHRRHELKYSRSELYDMVFKYGEAGSDASKERTVRNWEQGETQLNYQTIKAMCSALKCSSDYLLGLDECTTKNIQFIHDKTGLSEKTINSLCKINGMNKWFPNTQNDKLDAINLILSDEHEPTSFSSFLDILAGYFQFNIDSGKNTLKYTLGEHGITPCQVHKIGNGVSYDPSQVHFGLQDLESMYYLRIWDAIKELKEAYRKQKQPLTSE